MAGNARSYPREIESSFRALYPGEGLGEEADAAIIDLAYHGMVAGLDVHRQQLDRLRAMANKPEIVEHCPNDRIKFASEEQILDWLAEEGRQMVGIYDVPGHTGPLNPRDVLNVGSDDVVQLAQGGFGPKHNDHILGANITTWYRVDPDGSKLAKARRHEGSGFGLGRPLGHVVIGVATGLYQIRRNEISLDVNGSNERALRMYGALGFIEVTRERIVRPTLEPAGKVINGWVVRYQTHNGAMLPEREVDDERVHEVLGD